MGFDRVLVERDGGLVWGDGYRGKRKEGVGVRLVGEEIGELGGVS
ncbi:hypothetical protein [Staphylococcus saprophyticus]|nr:hypothetical protein [Staphylococcus saprophyticus]